MQGAFIFLEDCFYTGATSTLVVNREFHPKTPHADASSAASAGDAEIMMQWAANTCGTQFPVRPMAEVSAGKSRPTLTRPVGLPTKRACSKI